MEKEHDSVVEELFRTRMPRYCDELPPNPSTLISKALCKEPLTTHNLRDDPLYRWCNSIRAYCDIEEIEEAVPAHVAFTRRCWFSNLIRGFERHSRARGSSEFDEKRNQATDKKPPEKQYRRTPCI